MTAAQFRRLALGLAGAVEKAHHGHPDFRVKNRIFATLGPDETWGMVKLDPARQADLVRRDPDAFEPIAGAWGRAGCTKVHLARADRLAVESALREAWARIAEANT